MPFDTEKLPLNPPRVVLYAHDGSGFGHLMRIARLAATLQQHGCACLIVTGTREASWIIPQRVEFVKVPSWDSMLKSTGSNGCQPWLHLPRSEILEFRASLLDGVIDAFNPDVLIVDHLPLGLRNELQNIIRRKGVIKYLIMRGIIDSADRNLLDLCAADEFAEHFHRIVIAADKRITDGVRALPLGAAALSKASWVGYMGCGDLHEDREARWGRQPDRLWVVCSAGSGLRGESLFKQSIHLASNFPDVSFDVIIGARSTITVTDFGDLPSNVRISSVRDDLPAMHFNADIVITSGGYNSLVESVMGGAYIITCPVNQGLADEQLRHSAELSRHYPIIIATTPEEIGGKFEDCLNCIRQAGPVCHDLNTNGITSCTNLILRDIGKLV